MKPNAIVYSSNTGFTATYARMLSEKLGIPAHALEIAGMRLSPESNVIYMGWLMANHVKGYGKAARMFHVQAVCGVGLCGTGEQLKQVRSASFIPENVALFTLQGGMDRSRLTGMNKFCIDMLEKALAAQKKPSELTTAKLEVLRNGGDFVSEESLADVVAWFQA